MKCKRCGVDQYDKVCSSCMKKWTDMRGKAWKYLESRYGKMNGNTLPVYQKEMKRLEKIWRKNPEQFQKEIGATLLNPDKTDL